MQWEVQHRLTSLAMWNDATRIIYMDAAKAFGVSTGEAIWQAKQKCQDLVIVEPHYEQYMKFSKLAREIYDRYDSQVMHTVF